MLMVLYRHPPKGLDREPLVASERPAAILRPIVPIRSPLDVPPPVPRPGTGAIRPPTPGPPVPEVLDEAVRTLGYGHERETRRLPVQGRVDLFEGASVGWEQGPAERPYRCQ